MRSHMRCAFEKINQFNIQICMPYITCLIIYKVLAVVMSVFLKPEGLAQSSVLACFHSSVLVFLAYSELSPGNTLMILQNYTYCIFVTGSFLNHRAVCFRAATRLRSVFQLQSGNAYNLGINRLESGKRDWDPPL